ncbi:hypothetical protein [Pseudomonas rubra]|uniref:Uncharacterized protein n=1 Tax=Pseudomonas rubra TaxID=2942627 RepID=A0ABT5P9N8_9PSED|nr:hypothetical protein [Pseudomonas rubra]MDD1014902.1 hypothetical protein [Pseudomonas rubra]MDD1040692.1 hypothetical protein [Pseudomonas rubra]MDD1156840.1 hypothetical protein [Pseudomonas rubra]
MANTGFNGVLSLTPTDIGQKMALATVDYFTKTAWNSLIGDKTDTVIKLIKQMSVQLDEIRSDISKLSLQIRDFQLDAKFSDVESHCTDIQSIHDRYQTRLKNYMQAKAEGDTEHADRFARELTEIGEAVKGSVYTHLAQIHRLLTMSTQDNSGLLQLFNQKYKERDLFTRFFAMQYVVTRFFTVQMQAITLMTLAGMDKSVCYDSFKDDVKAIDSNIKAQISLALSYIPLPGRQLIEAMIRPANMPEWMPPTAPSLDPDAVQPLEPQAAEPIVVSPQIDYFPGALIKTGVNTSIRSVVMRALNKPSYVHLGYGTYYCGGSFSASAEPVWNIVPANDMAPPVDNQPYLFIFEYLASDAGPLVLGLSGSQYGAVPEPLPSNPGARNNTWAIYSDDGGALRFEYHGNYVDGAFNGCHLYVDPSRNTELYYSKPSADTGGKDLFMLSEYLKQVVTSA